MPKTEDIIHVHVTQDEIAAAFDIGTRREMYNRKNKASHARDGFMIGSEESLINHRWAALSEYVAGVGVGIPWRGEWDSYERLSDLSDGTTEVRKIDAPHLSLLIRPDDVPGRNVILALYSPEDPSHWQLIGFYPVDFAFAGKLGPMRTVKHRENGPCYYALWAELFPIRNLHPQAACRLLDVPQLV